MVHLGTASFVPCRSFQRLTSDTEFLMLALILPSFQLESHVNSTRDKFQYFLSFLPGIENWPVKKPIKLNCAQQFEARSIHGHHQSVTRVLHSKATFYHAIYLARSPGIVVILMVRLSCIRNSKYRF